MNPVKVAVLVSGGGTNLQALLDAQAAGRMPHAKLVCVVSSKENVFALERAQRSGLPAIALPRKSFSDAPSFCDALHAVLQEHGVQVVVLAGFLCILSPGFIAHYPGRIINVHPALIPSFCGQGYYGLRVHQAALERGVQITGATVHIVNEMTDGGPILMQKAVDVLPGDTPETLQRRVMEEAEWVLLPKAVEKVCALEEKTAVSK